MNLQDVSKQVRDCFPEISLESTLDKQFYLCYFLHMSYSDLQNMEVAEFNWFYQRLVKQKDSENKEADKVGVLN